MTVLAEVLSQLDAAKEGSRELDRLIWLFLGVELEMEQPPFYTTSLDAAASLVPEGYDWEIGTYHLKEGEDWPVGSGPAGRVMRSATVGQCLNGDGPRWEGDEKSTPALALCAAALPHAVRR